MNFTDAVRKAGQKFFASKPGRCPNQSQWYLIHFVEWISDLGYHVELTGNEFEIFNDPMKAA